MALEPLKQFICDHCGTVIEKVEDGWLEWIDDGKNPQHGFRIVHVGGGCYYPDSADISDNHLQYFMGIDGLSYLLSLTDNHRGSGVAGVAELAEVIRRLHLPYYEEARRYMEAAVRDGFVENDGCWRQSDMERIVKEYGEG